MTLHRRVVVSSFAIVVAGAVGILGVLAVRDAVKNGNRAPISASNDVPQSVVSFARPQGDDAEFVGSEACGVCHSRIWQSYRQHPMAQSLAAPLGATPIERYEVTQFSPPRPRHYRGESSGAGVPHH